jgi:hypothetical protein
MIATVIHVCAIVIVSGVWFSTDSELFRKPALQLAILALGVIGGAAIMVSGFYVMEDWGKSMENVDFEPIDHANPKRLPSGLYFLPSITTALGAVAAFVFGWRFYQFWRALG